MGKEIEFLRGMFYCNFMLFEVIFLLDIFYNEGNIDLEIQRFERKEIIVRFNNYILSF